MADRAKKISELTPTAAPLANSAIVVNVGGNTYSVTLSVLFNTIPSNTTIADAAVLSANTIIVRNEQTPANTIALTISKGTVFFDENYIYVATANNTVKRAALTSF
jgi:hypothetical protein